ncbi:hypothetical protein cyc_02909 [Cyclospora cayetanensis]|uniref:Uncharacterized protein n=1 Tax=Cyclospora cayetanensis TaxID=88456 RepID=A0A1D3CYJ0_9EIME|nr:hypothetical protein cyc_02909 [Cyclospora cayetanensis]
MEGPPGSERALAEAAAAASVVSPACERFILDFLRDRAERIACASARAAPTALILLRLKQKEIEGVPKTLKDLLTALEALEAVGKLRKTCGNWEAVSH